MKKLFRHIATKKKALLLGIATFAALTVGATTFMTKTVMANDCSGNAIMTCGTSSASDFINKVEKKVNPDLQTIYSAYNLTPADYGRFVTSAKPGTAYKDGRIVVAGRTVATNAQSIGRDHFSYAHPKVIGGKTYWESRAQDVFLSNSIPVMVLFNAKGQMQFAVMYDCGNPTNGTPNNPTYACNNLSVTQVNRTTYKFSTSASAGNGATINHVVYDFGDGKTQTETNPATVVTHTYANANTYNAKVTVYVNVPGSQTYAIAAAGNCVKKITVTPAPEAACTLLTALALDRTRFTLKATASAKNGATISSYSFVVRDSNNNVVTSPKVTTTATTASTTVDLQNAGTYSAQVTVNTSLGALTSNSCKTTLTVGQAPQAACTELKAIAVDRNTFTLNAAASASNGATISSYNFVVRNSSNTVVSNRTVSTTAKTASTTVSLTDAGTYSAQVTVNTSLGALTSDNCKTTITVTEAPAAACVELTAIPTDRTHFTLNATASVKNGATIQSYDFVVKDAQSNVAASQSVNTTAQTASTNVVLTTPGTYSAQVTVNTSLGKLTGPQCIAPITVTNAPTPGVTITKHVDNLKVEEVAVGQNFVYELVVTNNGQQDLTNVLVTDPAPNGVTMLSADLGTVANNAWTYTIPSLKMGESVTINITAKVNAYMAGSIVNTACVNAPEVNPEHPNENDSCDTATVTVTPPTPTPTVLPNTGAGNVIGIFAGIVAAGTIASRVYLSRKLSR